MTKQTKKKAKAKPITIPITNAGLTRPTKLLRRDHHEYSVIAKSEPKTKPTRESKQEIEDYNAKVEQLRIKRLDLDIPSVKKKKKKK